MPDNTNVVAPKTKSQSIGKIALRDYSTAKEAADYVNGSGWKREGYIAVHKDKNDVSHKSVRPGDWAGRARDDRWLIIHAGQDAA